MRVHFIAIGGAVMHNLALDLHQQGHTVSGSDDQIFEPSRSRLEKAGLLPPEPGWFPEKITQDLDAIVLGMHARENNTELQKALALGIKVYSFPEFVHANALNKKRVVIAGSHGKTSITSMVMHVLKNAGMDFDYLVGSQIEGFTNMVRISKDAPIIVIEGDEYLTSALDPKPKFLWYKPHIAVISGIAWDHINVFPTFDNYLEQFASFIDTIETGGQCIYYSPDENVSKLVSTASHIQKKAYQEHPYHAENHSTFIIADNEKIPVQIFGRHNMANLMAAKEICLGLGVTENAFYGAIKSFAGAGKRLERMGTNAFLDFAHAPSKLQATVKAIREQYPHEEVTIFFELHTYSTLTKAFLQHYRNTLDGASKAYIVYNPESSAHKKLPPLDDAEIISAFSFKNASIVHDANKLKQIIAGLNTNQGVYLFMSSGNFLGVDIKSYFGG